MYIELLEETFHLIWINKTSRDITIYENAKLKMNFLYQYVLKLIIQITNL